MSSQINNAELQDLLWCSFRYALGRSSYITSVIATLLKNHSKDLNDYVKEAISKEILEAINSDKAGMQMDVNVWKDVVFTFDEERDNAIS